LILNGICLRFSGAAGQGAEAHLESARLSAG
jgi:hypothetical protein